MLLSLHLSQCLFIVYCNSTLTVSFSHIILGTTLGRNFVYWYFELSQVEIFPQWVYEVMVLITNSISIVLLLPPGANILVPLQDCASPHHIRNSQRGVTCASIKQPSQYPGSVLLHFCSSFNSSYYPLLRTLVPEK